MCGSVYGQSVHRVNGTVTDTAGVPVAGVQVTLFCKKDTFSTVTAVNGIFHFAGADSTAFNIALTFPGVKKEWYPFVFEEGHKGDYDLKPLMLRTQVYELSEVKVVADPVVVKEDTIEYRAGGYKLRAGALAEDLIKKLPGITVDGRGNITAQGKEITKIQVNGRDFFDGDITTATKNLPADVIANIQVIEDYGEQAKLTGIKSGSPQKIININIKKSKSVGSFGNATLAAGSNNRYLGSVMANNFDNDRMISIVGTLNSTNITGFNLNNVSINNSENGISNNQSAGINYRDKWGENLSVYGSYSFSGKESSNSSTMLEQDINPLNTRTTRRTSENTSKNTNHRFQWNLEYKPDTTNYIKISPSFSLLTASPAASSVAGISRPGFFTNSTGTTTGNSQNVNAGINLFYNHKFKKNGRSLTLSAGADYTTRDEKQQVNNLYLNTDSAGADSTQPAPVTTVTRQQQTVTTDNSNMRTTVSISYIEPVNATTFIEASYNYNRSGDRNNRDVADYDTLSGKQEINNSQTNHYTNSFTTIRYGLNLKKTTRKYNFVIGLVLQPSTLKGHTEADDISTSHQYINWIPNARFVYNFPGNNSISISYNGTGRPPGFRQLQPVTDSSNLSNIIVGNPNLNAEFTNRINLNFNSFDRKSGTTLHAGMSADETQNKIVNATQNDPNGTGRTTTYLNTGGYYNVSANVGYTKPFADRKYSVSINFNGIYNSNTAFTDNQRNNGINWNFQPSARLHADIADLLDADLTCNYGMNKTITRYGNTQTITRTQNLSLGINGKTFFLKDWTIGYDYSKMFNYGYSTSVSNPDILSLYVEYTFLRSKLAKVRLQGLDLFNENTGISHTVNGTTVTDSYTSRLGRYFLLGFTLQMKKFTGKATGKDVD